jgi:hypothetical protein
MIAKELDGATVLFYTVIDERLQTTGRTTHRVDGQVVGDFYGLAICQYEGAQPFYLFYCDANWQVITDTCHQTLADAKLQAEFEYKGVCQTWNEMA